MPMSSNAGPDTGDTADDISSRQSKPGPLDLSSVPPLIQPSPPSNTLLITNLDNLDIFHPTIIITLRDLINKTASIHTWAPIKSMRRIIVTFFSIDDAFKIRQTIDGQDILGSRARVYFGQPTATEAVENHLQAPRSQKLFFISPPPSPPHGWQMKNEDPPNKEVHAEDLSAALSNLHGHVQDQYAPELHEGAAQPELGYKTIFRPDDNGTHSDLPVIAVDDLSASHTSSAAEESDRVVQTVHTARPPVELME